MKRLANKIIFLLIFVIVVPISTSACGGFIAIKGEKIFHSVYCEKIVFENLDKMRWFDTASKAEGAGLEMCELCSECYDWYYDSEYCDFYWFSDDRLLLTAMELSVDYGRILEAENYELDHECDYESGYLSGYDYGYEAGYDEGYERGYEAGHDQGVLDGIAKAERKAEERKEEVAENRKGLVFTIAGLVVFSLLAYFFDNTRRYKK